MAMGQAAVRHRQRQPRRAVGRRREASRGAGAEVTTLLVGRGLLGGHVEAQLLASGDDVHTVVVPWRDHDAALRALLHAADTAARHDDGWQLAWCAGAGVVATPAEDLAAEVRIFRCLRHQAPDPAEEHVPGVLGRGPVRRVARPRPPSTRTPRWPPCRRTASRSSRWKRLARQLTRRGTRLLVGRISNLYGPGQDLSKPQGLISQLCLAHETRRTLSLYVSSTRCATTCSWTTPRR